MPRDPKALLKSAAVVAGIPMQTAGSATLAAQMGSALAGIYRGQPLPEDPRLFSDPGLFGPLTPAEIYPIDSANPGAAGGPPPRVWQYPVGWNMPTGPRAYEAVSFTALEAISDRVDAVRKAIELIKDEVGNADFEIVLNDDRLLRKHGPDYLFEERMEIRRWFDHPDRIRGLDWGDWSAAALEEALVKDALSIYPRRTVGRDAGPLGSDLYALQILDGKTIKPLIDMQGVRPARPNPAYQQFIYGVPRSEFAAPPDDETPVAEFMAEELFYLPKVVRSKTVYGFPPVEQVMIAATTYLKREQWWQSYFTDSDMPGMFITASEDWNPDQILRYEAALHSRLASDPSWRWRMKVIPGGAHVTPVKQPNFEVGFDEFLIKVIAMVFSVTPAELGFAHAGGLGGRGFSEEQAKIQQRKGVTPWRNFLARKITSEVIHGIFKMPDLRFTFVDYEEEDSLKAAESNKLYVGMGAFTVNQIRNNLGQEPFPIAQANEPMVMTTAGPVLLKNIPMEPGVMAPTPFSPQQPTSMMAGEPHQPFPKKEPPAQPPAQKGLREELDAFEAYAIRRAGHANPRPFSFQWAPDSLNDLLGQPAEIIKAAVAALRV